MTDNMNWLPINTAPKEFKPFNMFVAIALEVLVVPNGAPYTSDPWCVWRDRDGSFARWPHSFAPTHWCPLPDYDPHRSKYQGLVTVPALLWPSPRRDAQNKITPSESD